MRRGEDVIISSNVPLHLHGPNTNLVVADSSSEKDPNTQTTESERKRRKSGYDHNSHHLFNSSCKTTSLSPQAPAPPATTTNESCLQQVDHKRPTTGHDDLYHRWVMEGWENAEEIYHNQQQAMGSILLNNITTTTTTTTSSPTDVPAHTLQEKKHKRIKAKPDPVIVQQKGNNKRILITGGTPQQNPGDVSTYYGGRREYVYGIGRRSYKGQSPAVEKMMLNLKQKMFQATNLAHPDPSVKKPPPY